MQKNDVTVTGNKITGTLKYLSTGTIASDWGAGYFLARTPSVNHFPLPALPGHYVLPVSCHLS